MGDPARSLPTGGRNARSGPWRHGGTEDETAVVPKSVDLSSVYFSREDAGRFDPGPASGLADRLDEAMRLSRLLVARSDDVCREAVILRLGSISDRVRRSSRSVPRSTGGDRRAGVVRPGADRDPLATTVAVARACEQVSRIEFFGAGRRSNAPAVQLAALAEAAELDPRCPSPSCESRVRIYATSRGVQHLVRLVGELDLSDADRVRDVLVDQAGSTVVLDLTDLRFVDAAGVAGIVSAYRLIGAAGHELRVRGARGIVRRVFEITELGYLLRD